MNRQIKLWNFWPPFLFSGIKILSCSSDFKEVSVQTKLRFWNANYVGTQFGGIIYMMADPFYMIMLIKNLGPGYSVWDKSAKIRYLKPGKTALRADFKLTEEDIKAIVHDVEEKGKIEWVREIEIKNTDNEIIALVEKTISIKKK